jgi:hypothetical protein
MHGKERRDRRDKCADRKMTDCNLAFGIAGNSRDLKGRKFFMGNAGVCRRGGTKGEAQGRVGSELLPTNGDNYMINQCVMRPSA